MTADQREVDDADREPRGHPVNADPIDRILELHVDRHQCDDDRQCRAEDADRALVRSLERRKERFNWM